MEQLTPTDFLTSESSFLSGMASAINVAGNFHEYNRSATPVEADAYAIGADWGQVGNDMRFAIAEGDKEKSG